MASDRTSQTGEVTAGFVQRPTIPPRSRLVTSRSPLEPRRNTGLSLGKGEFPMGAHPYWYVVDYKSDIEAALQELREREFQAGRYNPVIPFLDFPIGPRSPAPGAQHTTMAEAFEEADADGTREPRI